MKIGRVCDIRDVLGKGKWAINIQLPDTWRERHELELSSEKSDIKLLELLRSTKPDKLSFRNTEIKSIPRHPGVGTISKRLNSRKQK